jgi:hypothetical protein
MEDIKKRVKNKRRHEIRFEQLYGEVIQKKFYKYAIKKRLTAKEIFILLGGKLSIITIKRWSNRLHK